MKLGKINLSQLLPESFALVCGQLGFKAKQMRLPKAGQVFF
ncbi:MAG: hypothetical protein R3C56_26580 [Pirellulaceae bacterium]